MKVTHINEPNNSHTVIIECESRSSDFDSLANLRIVGSGLTKAAAIQSGLIAIEGAAAEIKEMREKLSAL